MEEVGKQMSEQKNTVEYIVETAEANLQIIEAISKLITKKDPEEYVCLRLSKEINLDKLKEEISKIRKDTIKATTWKDIEIALFKSEFE